MIPGFPRSGDTDSQAKMKLGCDNIHKAATFMMEKIQAMEIRSV